MPSPSLFLRFPAQMMPFIHRFIPAHVRVSEKTPREVAAESTDRGTPNRARHAHQVSLSVAQQERGMGTQFHSFAVKGAAGGGRSGSCALATSRRCFVFLFQFTALTFFFIESNLHVVFSMQGCYVACDARLGLGAQPLGAQPELRMRRQTRAAANQVGFAGRKSSTARAL